VTDIVISEHIIERDSEHPCQKRKVFRRHISTGEDQVHARETGRRLPLIQDRLNAV
jgi:hypothetical protein